RPDVVAADTAVELRAEALDRRLGGVVLAVRAPADDAAAEGVERVLEQHELAERVHVGALKALGVERVADLDAASRRHDVVVARAADHVTGGLVDYRERDARPGPPHLERLLDVRQGLAGRRDRR